jgi:hypothetical protein
MIFMKKTLYLSIAFLTTPFLALAQVGSPSGSYVGSNIVDLINAVGYMVRLVIPILVALAVVVFFWGLVKYIWGQGKDTATGRSTMIAGLISIFVMVTLWGVITFFQSTLNISPAQNNLTPPHIGQ